MRYQVYVQDKQFGRYESRQFRTKFFARRYARFYELMPMRYSVQIRPTFLKG